MAGFGQILYPPAVFPIGLPATIAGSGTWNSGLLFNDGYRNLTVAVQMNQAATLAIQLFLDLAGTIPRAVVGSPFTITANTLLIVDLPPAPTATAPGPYMPPWASFSIQIANGATPATITAFQMILSAG